MFEKLKHLLDSYLESVVPILIKKSIDTNEFISEEAQNALNSMCKQCGEHKTITSLLN